MTKHCVGKKILLVEDDPIILGILQSKLQKEGACVLTANDGAQGLKTAKTEEPDLIVLDLLMPVLDGIEFLKSLRADEWGKTAKIFILTNLEDIKKVEEALRLGVHDFFLKKDWSAGELTQKILAKLSPQNIEE